MDRRHFVAVSSQTKLHNAVGTSIEGRRCINRIVKALEQSQRACFLAMVVLVVFELLSGMMMAEFGGVSESQPGSVTHGIEYTNS